MTSDIEELLVGNKWQAAGDQARAQLKADPEDHLLWARLSAAEYGLKNYEEALAAADRALQIMPDCSLAQWEQADALQLLGRYEDAIVSFRRITARGVDGIVNEPCSEGLRWSRSIVSDSHYKISRALGHLKKFHEARQELHAALQLRGPGIKSLYSIADLHALAQFLDERISTDKVIYD